jgi:DNA-directed RNA polymerase subunit RPC12/RpoP
MSCPHCSAKVFADPCASVLSCWDCKAKVINGVTFKGNGGSKKRKAEKAKRQAEQKEAQAQLTTV